MTHRFGNILLPPANSNREKKNAMRRQWLPTKAYDIVWLIETGKQWKEC